MAREPEIYNVRFDDGDFMADLMGTSLLQEAVWIAVSHTWTTGQNTQVTERIGGRQVIFVEADTKVDDLDPSFPAIVHRTF